MDVVLRNGLLMTIYPPHENIPGNIISNELRSDIITRVHLSQTQIKHCLAAFKSVPNSKQREFQAIDFGFVLLASCKMGKTFYNLQFVFAKSSLTVIYNVSECLLSM